MGEQIRSVLARLLHEVVTDPRIGLVTLTHVDVAPDFSSARIYWSALRPGTEDEAAADAETAAGLASAAGFLRRALAHELSLRRTPELHFVHDPSLAQGARTLSLLRELRDDAS